MMRNCPVLLTLGLLVGCPASETPPDAGFHDAGGAADAGAPDVSHGPCAAWCSGSCLRQRCIPARQPDCDEERPCVEGQRCSVEGKCFSGDCLSHNDCAANQRCAMGRCLDRVSPEAGVAFERVEVPTLNAHVARLPRHPESQERVLDNELMVPGFGAALFDVDGDLDLDLFLGNQDASDTESNACIYRNVSLPANLRFEPIPEHCQPRTTAALAGFGLDLEGDGYHELLIGGRFIAELHRFHPQHSVTSLLELLPENDPRRRCSVNSAASFDLNEDGLPDLVIGCSIGNMEMAYVVGRPPNLEPVSMRNLAFLQTPSGELRLLSETEWNKDNPLLLEAVGATLAIGVADIDHDGLLDLQVSEEGIILRGAHGRGEFWTDAGGIYRRCGPDEPCRFEAQRLGEGDQQFGAYMGSGLLQLDGEGEFIYFTDAGYNRMVQFRNGVAYDVARPSATDIGYLGFDEIFSWGVVVDDFDRDGRDDLFVSSGSPVEYGTSFGAHLDVLFLQRDGALFNMHSADLGIAPFTQADSRHPSRIYSSRATLKSDLDGDGFLDLITVGLEGVIRLHREVPNMRPDPPRCTLVPVDRYVHGFGVGHTILADGDPRPRQWDSQGQNRAGTSPFVVTPWTRGSLRFPSGAEVTYDCQGQAGPVVLTEPDWLSLTAAGQTLTIQAGRERPPGAPSIYCQPSGQTVSAVEIEPGTFTVQLPDGTERYMLRFDARWVQRWWKP